MRSATRPASPAASCVRDMVGALYGPAVATTHRRLDALTLALAPLFAATVPALSLSLATGTWGLSWTDDWGYIASIRTRFFRTIRRSVGYGDMSLLGLLAAGRVAIAVIPGTATLDAVELVAAAVAAFALDVIGQRMQVRRGRPPAGAGNRRCFATPWTELATSFLTEHASLWRWACPRLRSR